MCFMDNLLRKQLYLLILALAGLSMAGYLFIKNPNIGDDSLHYIIPVYNYFTAQSYTYLGENEIINPPGYGFFVYCLNLIIHDFEYSAMLISLLSYLACIPVCYFITRKIFNMIGAVFIASFFVFSPVFLKYSYVSLSDMLYICISLFAFNSFYRCYVFHKGSKRERILLGVFLGACYLIRPEAFLIACLCIVILFIADWRLSYLSAKGNNRLKLALQAFIPLIVFILFAAPYMKYLYKQTNQLTFSSKLSYNLLVGEIVTKGVEHIEKLKQSDSERFIYGETRNPIKYIEKNKFELLFRYYKNFIQELQFLGGILIHAVVSLIFVALIHIKKIKRLDFYRFAHDIHWLPFSVFLSPLLFIPLFFIDVRFLLSYSVILLMLIAGTAGLFFQRILIVTDKMSVIYKYGMVVVLYLIFVSGILEPILPVRIPSLSRTLTNQSAHRGLREAGLWLGNNIDVNRPVKIMMPQKGEVALFYAYGKREPKGKAFAIDHEKSISEIVQDMIEVKIDYLILDNKYILNLPEFNMLWNNPENANKYGLSIVFWKINKNFQVYSILKT